MGAGPQRNTGFFFPDFTSALIMKPNRLSIQFRCVIWTILGVLPVVPEPRLSVARLSGSGLYSMGQDSSEF